MIIDIFSFAGELDLLELRLNILDNVVDEFIICEADLTTAGNSKPRYFEENKERYTKWLPKIKYYIMPSEDAVLKEYAEKHLPIPIDQHWWHREFIQKESMRYALNHLKDDDRVFIGDVDEIWNPAIEYPAGRQELIQLVYSYYLNNRSSEQWTGTSLMDYKDIKNDTLDNLRAYDPARAHMHAPKLENAGWHFTNQTGAEAIKKKIQSYAHQEFNQEFILNQVDQRIANNQDYLGRDFKMWVDESQWPLYLKDNRQKYLNMIK